MSSTLPVVFLAFANDMDGYLANLKAESRAIYDALVGLEQAGKVVIHREESVQFEELYQDLLTFKDRIVIFHYAGHADGSMLQLENEQGTASRGQANSIARLLGQQSSLQLVFLNGCATQDQVRVLHQAGVPAVIATSVKINDNKATQLALAFYQAIANDLSIYDAFDAAKSVVENTLSNVNDGAQLSIGTNRHPNFNFQQHDLSRNLEFEWTLFTEPSAERELESWRLSHAQKDWQIVLEDSYGAIRDTNDDIITLPNQLRQRTFDAIVCDACAGIAISLNAAESNVTNEQQEQAIQHCPLCDDHSASAQSVTSFIPDTFLTNNINANQAESIALALVEPSFGHASADTNSGNKDLIKAEISSIAQVWAPFWDFELETLSEVSGQSANIKDIHAQSLSLSWHDVNDQIAFGLSEVLQPAFSGLVCDINDAENWQWALSEGEGLANIAKLIDGSASSKEGLNEGSDTHAQAYTSFMLAPQKSMQQAFDEISRYLNDQLEQLAIERIGGQQQRSVNVTTRYKSISARSIFLPYWHVQLTIDNQPISVTVNGQTGAGRILYGNSKPAIVNQRTNQMKRSLSGQQATEQKSNFWISIFSGIGIGIMVGLLMGLAAPQSDGAKSVVAIFIGAVGVGLAALLGLNDKHFSQAKGLRIGSFGLAVALSALSGIYVRDHSLLSPNLSERVQEVNDALPDLSDQEVIDVIRGSKVSVAKDGNVTTTTAGINQSQGGLYSGKAMSSSACRAFDNSAFRDFSSAELIAKYQELDKDNEYGFKKLSGLVDQQIQDIENDKQDMLFFARDASCGYIWGADTINSESPVCQEMKPSQSYEQRTLAFSKIEGSNVILLEFEKRISLDNQPAGFALISDFLCATKVSNNT